jgi:hypothetical protein
MALLMCVGRDIFLDPRVSLLCNLLQYRTVALLYLIGPPCAKPGEGSSSWKVPLTVLLVLLVIGSSCQKAVQASERGPVLGKVHLAKGPISVAPGSATVSLASHFYRK